MSPIARISNWKGYPLSERECLFAVLAMGWERGRKKEGLTASTTTESPTQAKGKER
jgi:hypothetical protein